jgi:hypothetical protein
MSLINKMLQDLDARGSAPGEPLPPQVKPVAPARPVTDRRPRRRMIAAAVVGSLAGVALAWYALGPSVPVPFAAVPARAPAAKPAPVPPKADGAMTSTITMLAADSASAAATGAAPSATAPMAASAAPALVDDKLPPPAAQREQAAQAARPAPVAQAATAGKEADAPKRSAARSAAVEIAGLPAQSVAPLEPDSEEARFQFLHQRTADGARLLAVGFERRHRLRRQSGDLHGGATGRAAFRRVGLLAYRRRLRYLRRPRCLRRLLALRGRRRQLVIDKRRRCGRRHRRSR